VIDTEYQRLFLVLQIANVVVVPIALYIGWTLRELRSTLVFLETWRQEHIKLDDERHGQERRDIERLNRKVERGWGDVGTMD